MIQNWIKFNFFTMKNSLTRVQILRQIFTMRNRWIDCMSFFHSKFASEFVIEKSMKLNIFHFFVQNLRHFLRQIFTMRNQWNWFYFIFLSKICVKFCVKFRQCEIDKIEYISFFRSKFESNFASNYINEKLIVFHSSDNQNELQKSEKNSSRKKIYFLFSFRIWVRFCVRFSQFEIDEIDFILFFCQDVASESASDFVNKKSMKLIVFYFFVKNLRQSLRQISSMKNRWNWLYFVFLSRIWIKVCVRFRQWEIDEIDCNSFFRSKSVSEFVSEFVNEKSIELNIFHFFVQSLRQILRQNTLVKNRWNQFYSIVLLIRIDYKKTKKIFRELEN